MPFGCHVSTSVTSLEWRHSWCGIFTFTFSVLVTTDHDCAIQDDVTDCIPLLWHFLSKVDVIFNQIDSLWFKTFQCSPQRYSFKVSSKLFTNFYKYQLYSEYNISSIHHTLGLIQQWENARKMKDEKVFLTWLTVEPLEYWVNADPAEQVDLRTISDFSFSYFVWFVRR